MNAIILAAGMGTRLRPLTNDRPKCLVEVNGIPMVERQIQFLKEKGIDDITLISGYKAEALDFLKEKYGVDIVFNDRYDTCNNINSLYIVRDRFHDTYVMEGDVYMDKNVLISDISRSTYFARKKKYENEWGLEVDENNKLMKINIGAGDGYLMSGISYWKADDCKKIIKHMEEVYATKDYTNLYWDNLVLDIYQEMDILVNEIEGIYEIDTPEELHEVEFETKIFNTGESAKELKEKYNPDGSLLRKAQLRMLDMLLYIDKICKDNGILYRLDGGNVLGAVRHGGFIPWDDDVDIVLDVKNYKKLCRYLENHPHPQYKIQNHKTDKGYYGYWSVLRDTKSEYIQDSLIHNVRNYRGLQIDIFPVDDNLSSFLGRISNKLYSWNMDYFIGKNKILATTMYFFIKNIVNPIFLFLSKILQVDKLHYMYCYGCCYLQKIEKRQNEPYRSIMFEGHKFPGPSDVEGYLNVMYGNDYITLPNVNNRNHHKTQIIIK